VVRVATEKDLKADNANRKKEEEAFKIANGKIKKHNLDMKLINVKYTFDSAKIVFYFVAQGRVDFRELVKDLASVFRTRIELRQIGVRDETKMIGGLGICGRPLCCSSFLNKFESVSINMAKEQNLSLNPVKISGICGRLMCCLSYENETYEEINKNFPNIGQKIRDNEGDEGIIISRNSIKKEIRVSIINESNGHGDIRTYNSDDVTVLSKSKNYPKPAKGHGEDASYEKELLELEKKEKVKEESIDD
jgi:cell fate regulator YaaT (PSP1 superfamily)